MLNTKSLIDIFALVISIMALGYTVFQHKQTVALQTSQTQKQEMLEISKSRPYFQIEFLKVDSEMDKGILLENVGSGPGVIYSFKYYVNESAYARGEFYNSWLRDEIRFKNKSCSNLIFSEENNCFEELNILTNGYVITPGENGKIFLLREEDNIYEKRISDDIANLIIEIEYKSLSPYDEEIYYLKYSENFLVNNVRVRNLKNEYE